MKWFQVTNAMIIDSKWQEEYWTVEDTRFKSFFACDDILCINSILMRRWTYQWAHDSDTNQMKIYINIIIQSTVQKLFVNTQLTFEQYLIHEQQTLALLTQLSHDLLIVMTQVKSI